MADAVEIVKFHGDLSNPERMVLSESDYERRLKLAEVEDQRLLSDVLGRAILFFLGYSFRDWNVSYLFRIVNDQFGPPLPPRCYRSPRLYSCRRPPQISKLNYLGREISRSFRLGRPTVLRTQ